MRTAPWIVAALLAGLAVACKDKTTTKPKAGPVVADAAPVAVDAARPAIDAGPGPLTPLAGERGIQIYDLTYGGYTAPGLPAIKDDGSEIVTTAVADDGGRGYLDLVVVVLDGATGRPRERVQLADADETSEAERVDDEAGNLAAEEALAVKVRARVAQVNARLTTGAWRSLVSSEREDLGPPQPVESLTAGDLTFGYDLADRRLTVRRGGAKIASHDLRKLAPGGDPRADQPCPGDLGYLEAVHVDAPSKKVLVELGAVAQGHNCGGAGPTFAVIPLP